MTVLLNVWLKLTHPHRNPIVVFTINVQSAKDFKNNGQSLSPGDPGLLTIHIVCADTRLVGTVAHMTKNSHSRMHCSHGLLWK